MYVEWCTKFNEDKFTNPDIFSCLKGNLLIPSLAVSSIYPIPACGVYKR